jgi:ParB family chromosome partitioning protein
MDSVALEELANSIRLEGLQQPIIVRPLESGRYEIIAGHRRYCALKMIGALEAPSIVRDAGAADAEVARFLENAQRENLSPMEESIALTRFIDNSGLEPKAVAKRLGKTDYWLKARMLLMQLSDALKAEVHAGRLAISAALALNEVTDNTHRDYLTRYAIEGGASATVIREWVNAWLVHVAAGDASPAPAPDWIPGETIVIIQIPCAVCGTAHDHRNLAIVRVCHDCLDGLAAARHSSPPHAASG